MKFRSLMLCMVLLSLFIVMSPAWADDVPTPSGDAVVTASLDSPDTAAVFASEEVDRVVYISLMKSIKGSTEYYTPAAFISGAQRNAILLC